MYEAIWLCDCINACVVFCAGIIFLEEIEQGGCSAVNLLLVFHILIYVQ